MSSRKPTPRRKKAAGKAAPAAAPARSQRVVEAPKPKRHIPVVGITFSVIAILLVAAVLLTGSAGGSEAGEPMKPRPTTAP